jgi:DNA-nicking Smr family endonuclease
MAGSKRKPQAAPSASEDDALLFARAMGAVQPLRHQHKSSRAAHVSGPRLSAEMVAVRRLRALGSRESGLALAEAPAVQGRGVTAAMDDDEVFLRAGQSPRVLRDLRQGRWPIQASVDLHGCGVDQARARLEVFLNDCLDHGARCARVVHGVGYGSPSGAGVLGPQVRRWLANWADVLAYTPCPPAQGGAGALRVLLRPIARHAVHRESPHGP